MLFSTVTLLLAAISPVISLGFVFMLVNFFRLGGNIEQLPPQTK